MPHYGGLKGIKSVFVAIKMDALEQHPSAGYGRYISGG